MTGVTDLQAKYADKVKKLLAKAAGASTAEEAEAFAEKAQELMTKWGVEEAMLRDDGDLRDRVVTRDVPLSASYWQADVQLLVAVARASDCRVIVTPWGGRHQKARGHVTGYESDIERVEWLFASLEKQAARAAREAVQPWHDECSPWVFRRSVRLAFAYEVGRRLAAVHDRVVREEDAAQGGSLLPALLSKAEEVEAEERRAFPHVTKGRQSSLDVSGAGAAIGREAGRNASLARGEVRS